MYDDTTRQDSRESYFASPDPNYPQYQIPAPQKEPRKGGVPRPLFFLFGFLAGILVSLLFAFAILITMRAMKSGDTVTAGGAVDQSTIDKINAIDEVIQEEFLFDKDVDTQSGIIKGYMNSFNDPYTVYYTQDEYKTLLESMQGVFSGIGALVQSDTATGYVRVVRPYDTSPAYAAGLRADDLIMKVDGEDIAGLDLDLAVSKIRGEQGTTVDLTVYRPSTGKEFELTITRQRITVETITHKMLDQKIGYIKMDSFDEPTYQQYMDAFNGLKAQGMKALIVDIRSNGGGLLNTVTAILAEMLPAGVITYTETAEGKTDYIYSDAECVLDVPMVVLVNGYSASASEIFTGALQDYGAAEIIGTQTYGKGIVQSIMGLSDGSAIKVTTSRYYTPNGVCIHGVGITPDIVVEQNDTENDNQLDTAVEYLLKQFQ